MLFKKICELKDILLKINKTHKKQIKKLGLDALLNYDENLYNIITDIMDLEYEMEQD